MVKETEIKLRVSPATLAALRVHPLLDGRRLGDWKQGELFNQYYDTAARELAGSKVALRLRRDGGQYIQTLKTRGQSVAGLSVRGEWDWYLDQPQLDPGKLDDSCWPAALATLDKNSLQGVFTTDFLREKADIGWDGVRIEAALDHGKVIAGDREEEICELELELREGNPADLLQLALQLAADLPLMPCDISKAERGYRLFDPASYRVSLPEPELTAATSVDEAVAAIGWYLLGSSQRLAEQYRWSGHWKLLEQWLAQLIDLRALLGLGQAVPRQSSSGLRSQLDALLNDWRPRIQAGQQDESARQAAVEQFAAELQQLRWGRLSLELALWLLQRSWINGRKAIGNKLGVLALERWLPRQMKDEALELLLGRCIQEPGVLGEQLPRLERLLVWLRLARPLLASEQLEREELDRLYGELSRLTTLARQSAEIAAECAEERSHQAQVVQSLKAWKQLIR